MAEKYTPRLKKVYDDEIRRALIEQFGYANTMAVPRLDKIVINMGVGEATQDKKRVDTAASEMMAIAGQKPVITRAKKSVASFKLREGMPIGCKVTLRRERMYRSEEHKSELPSLMRISYAVFCLKKKKIKQHIT